MTKEDLNITINNIQEAWKYPELFENVSTSERWLSVVLGTYLLYKGLTSAFSHPMLGLTGTAVATGLLYRGITGYCPIKDLVGQQKEDIIPDEVVVTETYVGDELG